MYVHANFVSISVVVGVSILSSTLLGLATSAVADSQTQSTFYSAAYFLALLLLSGFLYSLQESAGIVQVLSVFLPLTFALGPLNAWMFGADPIPAISQSLPWLLGQVVLYGALAIRALRFAQRRL